MRVIVAGLAALLLVAQWSLWFGHGGWLRVWDLQRQLAAQRDSNAVAAGRNEELAAELDSLRQGREAVEERARYELHMMRSDETFFQFVTASAAQGAAGAPAAAPR